MKNWLALNGEKIKTKIEQNYFSGIGMIRGEYLLRELGKSILTPEGYEQIYEYLTNMCTIYMKEEVWYRFTELTSEEINTLEGTKEFVNEPHQIMGIRGLRRLENNLEEFEEEIKLIKKIYERYPNFGIILPFVNDAEQLERAITKLRQHGYMGKVGCMIEIPSAYFDFKNIVQTNISRIIIGLNDFTSFVFGAIRGSTYHEMNSSIIEKLILEMYDEAKKYKKDFLIAGYLSKALIEKYNNHQIPCIIHYHLIPQIFNKQVEYPKHLENVKYKTKKELALKKEKI